MVIHDVIHKRLERLQEYLTILRSKSKITLTDFSSQVENYAVAERLLHLSIEALLDVGNHIIAQKKFGTVDVMRDIPALLCAKGILSKALTKTFIQMIGFRNILVHDYLKIDHEIVYKVLKENLKDLEMIAKAYIKAI